MNVTCTNADCSEYQVPKDNSGGFPLEEIQCGKCGGPVVETTEAADTTGATDG